MILRSLGFGTAGWLAGLLLPSLAHAGPVPREAMTAALPRFEALVQSAIDKALVPGLAIAIVQDDEVVYLKGFGVREEGKPEKVDADTVFQLASFSKPISATVVAAVVGQGKISWDSKISDLDPTFRLADAYPTAELTVRDLFSHRSGLPGEAGNELEDLGFDRAAILHRLRLLPLDGFRSHYSYSNFGITEGAVAVAESAGKPWEDLAAQQLYRPLGMNSTSSRYADFIAHTDRAALHIPFDGKWKAALTREPDAQSPAGGVSSNVRDLAQWLRLELGNGRYDGRQLIAADALAATHEPLMARGTNPVNGSASFYGLGWNVEFGRHGLVWGHAGGFSRGARTLVSIMPEKGIGIVVLSNAFPTGVPEGIAESLFDLVLDGKLEKDWITPWSAAYAGLYGPGTDAMKTRYATPPTPASPALPLSAYVGHYANDYVGSAVITEEAGALRLALGPTGQRTYPLRSFDRDIFIYMPSEETPDMPASATFQIGPDGKATSVTLESLDELGFGVLKRVAD